MLVQFFPQRLFNHPFQLLLQFGPELSPNLLLQGPGFFF